MHYPLGRPSYSKCTAGFFFGRYGTYTGYPWFTPDDTRNILSQLQPSLVLSGDMHESCYYEHVVAAGGNSMQSSAGGDAVAAVPEWTVTSFNPLQGTIFPGFGILSLFKESSAANETRHSHSHVLNGPVLFHHCFLCPVIYSVAGHAFAASCLLLGFVSRRVWRASAAACGAGGRERCSCCVPRCLGGCTPPLPV